MIYSGQYFSSNILVPVYIDSSDDNDDLWVTLFVHYPVSVVQWTMTWPLTLELPTCPDF